MVSNARVADLIREARSDEIEDAIAAGEFYEMQTFMQALIELVLGGRVDEDIAANAATNRHDFLVALDAAKKNKAADEREAAQAAAVRGLPRTAAGLPPSRSASRFASCPSPVRGWRLLRGPPMTST